MQVNTYAPLHTHEGSNAGDALNEKKTCIEMHFEETTQSACFSFFAFSFVKSFCLHSSFNSALLAVNKDDACEGLYDENQQ